jgi:dTDP-4-dehydrorhamnose reductase
MLNPILASLLHGSETKLFTDQYTTPLFIEDISEAICIAIQNKLSGIYHLGMAEKFSRYEVGLHLSELLGLSHKKLVPFQMKDFSFPEERGPTNTIVSRKFEKETGFSFRNFRDNLVQLRENLKSF